MKYGKFEVGQLVMTCGIADKMQEIDGYKDVVVRCFRRYINGDWGDMCDEDKAMNDSAFKNGDDRIFASYETEFGKIWIITEWDRSVTTILLPEEY